mgnify:CR=1 FL=1|jgi:hypothetical protein|tara:strand:+ start:177 stop:404 length:228 start_codon:yes stop_codon:yes gene_type:complete
MARTLVRTEKKEFARDTASMALINTDRAAFMQYKAARARGSAVEELSAEVQLVKNDMQEIKNMLTQLTRVITDGK